MSDAVSKPPGRRMVYPYTYTAKLAQFPWKRHFIGHWFYRYLIYGTIASYPVIIWIDSKVNSPAAKAAHAERLRKEAEEYAAHEAAR